MSDRELRRILYVEDNADIREVASIALEELGGFSVRQCASGKEAIAHAPSFAPDLIVLDVMMPELDGPATLERLREHESLRATPVVFMTAKAQSTELERYRRLGAIGTIAKPFRPKDLPERLRAIWRRREYPTAAGTA